MSKNLILLSAAYLVFAVPLSFMDSRKFRISLPVLFFGAVVLLFAKLGFIGDFTLEAVKNLLYALISSFLIYFCTRVLTAQGLGFGDVFFGMYSAVYTGFYMNIIATVFASLLGVLYYLLLALVQKMKKKQTVLKPVFAIPFVPFITAGSVTSMLLFYVIA